MPEEIADINVVVDKYQHGGIGRRGASRAVVEYWEADPVVVEQSQLDKWGSK
jgi:hypothetical protein